MLAALSEPDRTRLVRLLGMLGSDHQGERANAGALADRFIRERELTWEQVVASEGQCSPSPVPGMTSSLTVSASQRGLVNGNAAF
jgi:hypothetical protein